MWENFFLKGLAVGLLFGMPVGAVGALTVQRILKFGPGAGILSGMGSSVADCIYACIGVFGLSFLSDCLLQNQEVIHILGGILILFMGVGIIRKKAETGSVRADEKAGAAMFLSSFAVAITNPASILSFLFVFSYFGISGKVEAARGIQLAAGVFMGTFFWWGMLAAGVVRLKAKIGEQMIQKVHRCFGAVLVLFGTAIFVRTVL
nr:LysE family transporter [uncultured Anaerostipes sp.]